MAKSRAQLQAQWRETNPPGLEDRPSIHEMIEETWQEKGRLKDLFAKVAKNWAHTGRTFGAYRMKMLLARHLKQREYTGTSPSQGTVKNTLYNATETPTGTALGTLLKITKAFNIENKQELMFWRISTTEEIDLDQIDQLAEKVIANPKDQQARCDLMKSLHESSGIMIERAAEIFGVTKSTVNQWLSGQHSINDIKTARLVAKTFVPSFLDEPQKEIRATRSKLIAAMTNIPCDLTLNDFIKKAQIAADKGNSIDGTKMLYGYLFTKNSALGISTKNAAKKLGETEQWLKHRMDGSTPTNEEEARKIAKIVEANTEQTEQIVDILTGIPSPAALMQKVESGEILFTVAAIKMRQRKGLTQMDMTSDNLSEQSMGKIEIHGTSIPPLSAVTHSNFFFSDKPRSEEQEWHISCAAGFPPLSTVEILERLNNMTIEPKAAIKHLLALNGYQIYQFGEQHGVRAKTFNRLYEYRAGPRTITKLAEIIGCSEQDLKILGTNCRKKPDAPLPIPPNKRPNVTIDDGGSVYDRLMAGME